MQRDSKYHTKTQEKYYCFAHKDSGKWIVCTCNDDESFSIKITNNKNKKSIIEIRRIVVTDILSKQYYVVPDQSLVDIIYNYYI